MGKITPIVVGTTNGEVAAERINEAMKTAEVGAGLSGDATEESPLVADVLASANKDLDDGDTSILDLKEFDQFTKITTVGTAQQFSLTNEKIGYFKLILLGGTINSTLFTHTSKTITLTWEAGDPTQYAPTKTNRFRFEIESVTESTIGIVGTLANEDNGVATLLALSDVFISDYAGKKGQIVKVVSGENGVDSFELTTNKDLDTPDTSELDLSFDSQFTKITTVGAGQQFSIINDKLKEFKLILSGGTINSTLFTHATKTITLTWEGGDPTQYAPTKTNRLRFQIESVTTGAIGIVGTISNEDNSGGVSRTTITSSATPTPTGGSIENEHIMTALALGATYAAPSGSADDGNTLVLVIDGNGTAHTLAFDPIYEGILIPSTTIAGETTIVGFRYNSNKTKWQCIGYQSI